MGSDKFQMTITTQDNEEETTRPTNARMVSIIEYAI